MLPHDPGTALVLAVEHAQLLRAQAAALRLPADALRAAFASCLRRAANRLDPAPLAARTV